MPTNILYALLFSPIRVTCPAHFCRRLPVLIEGTGGRFLGYVSNSLPEYTVSCRNLEVNSMILPRRENVKDQHSVQFKNWNVNYVNLESTAVLSVLLALPTVEVYF
jgi:hypothetical protein